MGSSAGGGGTDILPNWLAVLWTVAFLVVFATHVRHALESRGQRRLWHSGHVLMAVGMAFMYAPGSIDPLDISSRLWRIVFIAAVLVIIAGLVSQIAAGRAINVLWPLMGIDMAAMAYMWSPASQAPGLNWLLAAYFCVQAGLWGSDRIRALDRRFTFGAYAITPEGAVGTAVAEPLICYRDLRVSMAAMGLGMAYMLAAMALSL